MERQRTERKLKRERQGQTDLLILERRKIQQKSTPERRKKIIALQILGFFFENCYIIFIFFDNFLKIHYF